MAGRRKRKFSNTAAELQLDPILRQKVQNVFEKKFTYSKPQDGIWKVPENFTKHKDDWEIKELMTLKSDLNSLKDKLSDKDIVKWHQHTTFMNLAGNVNSELRQTVRPELCTQAWCKFYEMVSAYDLVDLKNDNFNSVHLCEAPGAFITSLNHYLVSSDYSGTWNWMGTTLNPYYEGNNPSQMIDDDRFVRGSYDNWDFGVDNTGNLMSWQNIQQIKEKVAVMGPVTLVTADGSIDCQNNPAEQEKVVSKLHYCEVLSSILILSPGGNMVLKKFTMLECDTICLLYLLNCLFTEVTVFKPATSKSGNSEVYLMCLGFLGIGSIQGQIEQLCEKYFSPAESSTEIHCLFSQDEIPEDFLQQHIKCCNYFTSLQEETIKNNLNYFEKISDDFSQEIIGMKVCCTDLYFSKYNVKSIPIYLKITQPQKQQKKSCNHRYREIKRNEGTYNDRVRVQALQWEQRVLHYDTYDIDDSCVEWFRILYPPEEEEVRKWACVTGCQVTTIMSSRFCDGKFVQQAEDIVINWKNEESKITDPTADYNVSSIISSLDILFNQSVYDFPCHVTIVTSAELKCDEIQKQEYVNKVTTVEDITEVCDHTILVYLDIFNTSTETDITSQKTLLKKLTKMFQVLPKENTVLIQMPTCLTRFTAGIIYLLSSCFQKVGFLTQPGKESLLQMLICYKYSGVSDFLLEHCCHLVDEHISKDSKSANVLLETVPILSLINDPEFVQFLMNSNENLLKSYITTIVSNVKQKISDQT
ncbi:cap-specific mRNA (nucleoside-2'-O-)-methyltransferase 2-like [Mytilus trossulus]|uniref:cap-specific mRNA (nucleoside-2'-O-)-methyltransferase 2-like n=1 Tax=Mytilus trossulus TaxID=6551 RepID=UPI0030043C69